MSKIVHVQTLMMESDLILLKKKTGKYQTKEALTEAIKYYMENH